MTLLGIGKLRTGHTVEQQFCIRDLQIDLRSIWADAGNEVLTSLHDDSLSGFGSTCGHLSLLQLGVLLCTHNKPHATRSSHGNVALDVLPCFLGLGLSPALVHLEDFTRIGEGQFQLESGFAVLFEKRYFPSLATHEVHQHAMLRRPSTVHRVHEVGHEEILTEAA